MTGVEDAIVAVYRSIDRRDWDALEKLLSPDVVYSRPGHPDFACRADFVHFYRSDRKIDSGRHSLRAIVADGSLGCCWGSFNGVASDGGEIDILFSDWFTFEDGLVRTRRTFISAPTV